MTVVYEAGKKKVVEPKILANQPSNKTTQEGESHHLPTPESLQQEKPTERLLSAYVIKPNHINFETQDREEKIMLLLRRHAITNLGWIVLAFLMTFLPIVVIIIPGFGFLPLKFEIVFFVMWYLFLTAFVLENFLSWYYNVYIITDERVVDVDFHSLLYKEVSQAKIDNIEDVTFVMGGVVKAMFNYGTVYIQTAGEKREFDFEDVPHPDRVAKVLNELILEEEQEKIEGRVK